ncbi:MAG: malate dehydrogenase [Deinococcales bacterium]
MKISILGAGMVGGAVANALAHLGHRLELGLYDKNSAIAQAQMLDINSGLTGAPLVVAKTLEEMRDSDVVIVAAGKRPTAGMSTQQIFDLNCDLLEPTLKRMFELSPKAVYINAAHPMDLMTNQLVHWLGKEHFRRVIGTGTLLETALLRQTLASRFALHPSAVQGVVIGEQGGSALVAWSTVRLAGLSLSAYLEQQGQSLSSFEQGKIADQLQHAVKNALQAKGSFLYGVGSAVAQIVRALFADSHELLTISAWSEKEGVALSLPRILGRSGVLETIMPTLTQEEQGRFGVVVGYYTGTFATQP